METESILLICAILLDSNAAASDAKRMASEGVKNNHHPIYAKEKQFNVKKMLQSMFQL